MSRVGERSCGRIVGLPKILAVFLTRAGRRALPSILVVLKVFWLKSAIARSSLALDDTVLEISELLLKAGSPRSEPSAGALF
jgi:hypothetical protein